MGAGWAARPCRLATAWMPGPACEGGESQRTGHQAPAPALTHQAPAPALTHQLDGRLLMGRSLLRPVVSLGDGRPRRSEIANLREWRERVCGLAMAPSPRDPKRHTTFSPPPSCPRRQPGSLPPQALAFGMRLPVTGCRVRKMFWLFTSLCQTSWECTYRRHCSSCHISDTTSSSAQHQGEGSGQGECALDRDAECGSVIGQGTRSGRACHAGPGDSS